MLVAALIDLFLCQSSFFLLVAAGAVLSSSSWLTPSCRQLGGPLSEPAVNLPPFLAIHLYLWRMSGAVTGRQSLSQHSSPDYLPVLSRPLLLLATPPVAVSLQAHLSPADSSGSIASTLPHIFSF